LDVLQCGFIGAVEVGPFPLEAQMGARICRVMRDYGVLTRPIGNVVVLMPPYCVTPAQLDHIFDALERALTVCLSAPAR
ncbi:MAG: adenosylmethionine--8-amino-7-oxononanoate transaminase, partial [Verrucomicrobiae bacterium]|nr:adenosylmethionine--8-amino-7-oxononanoate transaminase [Verrucomicrobiae bacterium]